jgi:FkbM family methyltransferase
MNKIDLNNFDWGWMENSEVTDLKPLLTKEVFEDRIYEKFFTVDEDDIVLDIGSSVGPFVYSILDKKPKHVYCLEPSSTEFSTLNKNLRGFPVTSIKKGIGPNNDGFYSCLIYGEEDQFIETVSFKTLVKDYSLEKINFLKTDCEGGEYDIFNLENREYIINNVEKISGEWHLNTPELKDKFRNFRDIYLTSFSNYQVFSVDLIDIKWDLWNEHFIEYYKEVLIYINNK